LDGFFQSEEIEQVLPYETILSCNPDTYHGVILNLRHYYDYLLQTQIVSDELQLQQ
jgi:hypothetical protein